MAKEYLKGITGEGVRELCTRGRLAREAAKAAAASEIEKAGEGSRGGKIIGHTSRGKPIYESANHPGHKDFTPAEHFEAGSQHFDHSQAVEDEWLKHRYHPAEGEITDSQRKRAEKEVAYHDTQGNKHMARVEAAMRPSRSGKTKWRWGQDSAGHDIPEQVNRR